MRESVIEQYLVDRVVALGGEVRKVKWIGRRGAPDRLVMLPPCQAGNIQTEEFFGVALEWRRLTDRNTTIWVELKAPGEKAKPHQAREHERMRRMGQRVVVIDSIEGVDEVLS